jgi:hypothetical protein
MQRDSVYACTLTGGGDWTKIWTGVDINMVSIRIDVFDCNQDNGVVSKPKDLGGSAADVTKKRRKASYIFFPPVGHSTKIE